MINSEKAEFGVVDFMVFVGSLVASIAVGIYYAVVDRKKKTLDNYYFADNNMSPFPVAMSISVTYISAMTVIGYPTEAYLFGLITIWYAFTNFLPVAIACIYYIPLIHRWKLTSIYEYLELRFNKTIRQAASVINIVNGIFYMAMTIYLPSLALNAVTPMSLKVSIILTSVVCVFYTTVGGMKAVIWTDTLQTAIMLAGSLAAFVKSVAVVGGFGHVWSALDRGERLNTVNVSLDPTTRNTTFSILVGMGVLSTLTRCCGQPISQRYLSCKNVGIARLASVLSLIPNVLFSTLAILSGCTMYAYFEGCDPITSNEVSKPDQLIPYMVVKIFNDTPGMAGLFVAAAYSGTLSTVSSGINSNAALVLEDFIVPARPKLGPVLQLNFSKGLVVMFGMVVMSFALCIEYIPGTLVEISLGIGGATNAPVLGIFTLGIFFPWTNSKGALVGQIVATVVTSWMAIGGIIYGDKKNEILPTSIEKCYLNITDNDNYTYLETTTWINSTESTMANVEEGLTLDNTIYAISHLYFGLISTILTVVVGLIVSFATGAQDPKELDPNYFTPMVDNKILPEKIRKFFRFGVAEYIEVQTNEDISNAFLLTNDKAESKTTTNI